MCDRRARALALVSALALWLGAPAAGHAEEPSIERARALSRSDRFDAALAEYDALLADAPDSRDARLERARVLAWAGRHAESLAALDELQEVHPEDPEAMVLQARVLGWSQRHDEAEARARAALALVPDSAEAHLVLGDVLAWAEHGEDALSAYAEAQRLLPADPRPRIGEGRVLAARGRDEEATAAFEAAQLLDPESIEARQGLRRLRSTAPERRARIDVGLQYDALDGDRSDWWREDVAIALEVRPRTTLFAGATYYRRYDIDDVQGSLGLAWAAPRDWWLGAGVTLGPENDVVARYAFSVDLARRLHESAILQLRYRRSWYVDDVETDAFSPGLELWPVEDVKLEARYQLTHVSGGHFGHSGSLRAELFPESRLTPYAAVAYGTEAFAPSTVQGAREEARSVSTTAGFLLRHPAGFGLRLGYAFQDLDHTYQRHGLVTGIWLDL